MDGTASEPPRAASWRAFLAVLIVLFVLLGLHAWVLFTLFDIHTVETDLYDHGWALQLPWLAGRGEWVGRDFSHPRGILWQALSWIASGCGAASWRWSVAGNALMFGGLGLALVAHLVRRAIDGEVRRCVALAIAGTLVLVSPSEALRPVLILYLAWFYASDSADELDRKTVLKRVVLPALLATVALHLAFERGVIAIASIGLMTCFAAVAALRHRASVRPVLVQLGACLGALIAMQALLALIAIPLGVDYLDHVRSFYELSRSYSVSMQTGHDRGVGSLGLLAIAVAYGLLVVWFVVREGGRDAGMWMAGALPELSVALVRADTAHLWIGTLAMTIVLALVALQRGRIPSALAVPSGVLAIALCVTVTWAHPQLALGWGGLPRALGLMSQEDRAASRGSYDGDLLRAVRWVWHSRRAGNIGACVATDESLGALHPIASLPGPTGLRWNDTLRERRARLIERSRCPHYLHRLFTWDRRPGIAGWIFGEDFLAMTRLYEPARLLGPAVVQMSLRSTPLELESRTLRSPVLGRTLELAEGETLTIPFSEPIEHSSLLRIEYTLEVPGSARFTGTLPQLDVTFRSGDEDAQLMQTPQIMGVNRRVVEYFAPDPWSAEQAWVLGVRPHEARTMDRVELRFRSTGTLSHGSVRLRVHSLRALPAPVRRDAGPVPSAASLPSPTRAGRSVDVARQIGGGRGVGRYAEILTTPDLVIRALPDERFEARFSLRIRPGLGDVLEGRVGLDSNRGTGVRFVVRLVDPGARMTERHVELFGEHLAPAGAAAHFELPLDPWVGRDVWVELALEPGVDPEFDVVRVADLRVRRDRHAWTIAGLVASDQTTSVGSAPIVDGYGDVFLHPRQGSGSRLTARFTIPPEVCLRTGLSHLGPRGDGARMDVSIVDGARSTTLIREHLEPGDVRSTLPAIDLTRWAGREVDLVFATAPHDDHLFDWVRFVRPRFENESRCGKPAAGHSGRSPDDDSFWVAERARGEDQPVLRNVAEEQFALEERNIFLHPGASEAPPATVAFAVEPGHRPRCLSTRLAHRGEGGDGAIVLVVAALASSEETLVRRRLRPGETLELPAIPLPEGAFDLELRTLPVSSADHDWVWFVEPRVAACAE